MRDASAMVGGTFSRLLLINRLSIVPTTVGCLTILVGDSFSGPRTQQQQSAPQTPSAEDNIDGLRRKAEQGDADAQFSLGLLYLKGRSVPQDKAEALKWFGLQAAGASGAEKTALVAVLQNLARSMTGKTLSGGPGLRNEVCVIFKDGVPVRFATSGAIVKWNVPGYGPVFIETGHSVFRVVIDDQGEKYVLISNTGHHDYPDWAPAALEAVWNALK